MTYFNLVTSLTAQQVVEMLEIPIAALTHEEDSYEPIPGSVFRANDRVEFNRYPSRHSGNVGLWLDAWEVPCIDPLDYLIPGVSWFRLLVASDEIDEGVFGVVEESPWVFARWTRHRITLNHYSNSDRERFGAWGTVDSRMLWDAATETLLDMGLPYVVDRDPVGVVHDLVRSDRDQYEDFNSFLSQACTGYGVADGTAWLRLRDGDELEAFREFLSPYRALSAIAKQHGSTRWNRKRLDHSPNYPFNRSLRID